ncbi:DUF349 domain-containing protein [Flavobacterium croceum]|uniref:DUF349 domain-containing protein n=1 Tax=Flavobacterium croceum TaxID=370975 RepID=UPI0024A91B29|nr:DUF349 domain-containing protein [Flavobacterium croceum]
MSEEKIDNLLPENNGTDGQTKNEVVENNFEAPIQATENSNEAVVEDMPAPENTVELTDEQVADDTLVLEDATIIATNAINNANAEESEDETIVGRHEIPTKDYEALSMEDLVSELETITDTDKVMSVRDHVEDIKKAFLSKYFHLLDEKREEFNAENQDPTVEFSYQSPLKVKFDVLYNQYKNKKNTHFKNLQDSLKANLENRMAIVEELKELVSNPKSNIPSALKQLAEIRERWRNSGPIPKDKYNLVWNNYHFHLENFYDFLDLDREARDQEFKNNLEHKQRIIARAEELLNTTDISNSFRELQNLHRIWKEEIGPVSREHREQVWQKFSEITKQMHDKREQFFESFKEREKENLAKKQAIIAEIDKLSQEQIESHTGWQQQIEKIEALRNEFFATGKVPTEVNEKTWSEFKDSVRKFNVVKNSFYKEIKKDQTDNLLKKQALIDKANALKDSEDFATTTPVMKQIQDEWKNIGHVPRKLSDKLWKEFKGACNHYFDRLKDSRKEEIAEEVEAFEKKKDFLEKVRSLELVGNHKEDLDTIKAHIETWKTFGKVPFNRRHIEGKFNKVLDQLFEKLSSSKKEGEMIRFANKLDSLATNDSRKIENEKIFILRKIDEVQSEIFQLENNIQFFANAKADNPMVKEVKKSIERHKDELQTWKEKLKQVNELISK